jgi:group I intron endonuclease
MNIISRILRDYTWDILKKNEDIVQYIYLQFILFFKYNIFYDSNYNLIFKYYYKKSGIYGFRCKITEDLYIGSAVNLEKRIKEHLKGRKSNILLQRALQKYGLINFEIIIYEIIELNNLKDLYELEDSYLQKYKPSYNFNLSALSRLGYKHSEETKLKISEAIKNSNNPMYGKTHNIETRKKMSISKQKKVLI